MSRLETRLSKLEAEMKRLGKAGISVSNPRPNPTPRRLPTPDYTGEGKAQRKPEFDPMHPGAHRLAEVRRKKEEHLRRLEEQANEYQVCRIRRSPSKSLLDVDPKDIFAGGRESVAAKKQVLGSI